MDYGRDGPISVQDNIIKQCWSQNAEENGEVQTSQVTFAENKRYMLQDDAADYFGSFWTNNGTFRGDELLFYLSQRKVDSHDIIKSICKQLLMLGVIEQINGTIHHDFQMCDEYRWVGAVQRVNEDRKYIKKMADLKHKNKKFQEQVDSLSEKMRKLEVKKTLEDKATCTTDLAWDSLGFGAQGVNNSTNMLLEPGSHSCEGCKANGNANEGIYGNFIKQDYLEGDWDGQCNMCARCNHLLTRRNRFSTASIDSGLSQSCVNLPLYGSIGSDISMTPSKSDSLPAFQSTPILESLESSSHPTFSLTIQDADEMQLQSPSPQADASLVLPPPPPPPPALSFASTHPRKKPVKTKCSMKALHWNRIQLNTNPVSHLWKKGKAKSNIWEKLEEPALDYDELEELFSIENDQDSMKMKFKRSPSSVQLRSRQFTKVLHSKRSQNLGIVLSGIRLPFAELKQALMQFDNALLPMETWQAIYDNRATEKELEQIQDQIQSNPLCHLDKPEEFLYNMNKVPFGMQRIQCFLFRHNFEEQVKEISFHIDNMAFICDKLMNCSHIEHLLSLLLAIGNYLNGGSASRGQADGFSLDILPKLKDIKGKNKTSLLHFIIMKYKRRSEKSDTPIPTQAMFSKAMDVNYTTISASVTLLTNQIRECQSLMSKVHTTLDEQATNQRFHMLMSEYLISAEKKLSDLQARISNSKEAFLSVCKFFSAPSFPQTEVVTPAQFFEPWSKFSSDFYTLWVQESHSSSR